MPVPDGKHLADVDPFGLAAGAREELLSNGPLGAATALGAAFAPAGGPAPGRPAPEEGPQQPLIEWAPTGALGGWGGDPWWPES